MPAANTQFTEARKRDGRTVAIDVGRMVNAVRHAMEASAEGDVPHDPKLLETIVEPAETLAFETKDLPTGWGTSPLLWRRKIDEWKKAKEL